MNFLPYTQEYIFIVSIMSGMILGFVWDVYRLFRHYIPLGRIWTAAGDILFWLFSIKLGMEIIFDISYGNIRLFILLGFVFGAILYFYGVSNFFLKIIIFLIDFILNTINRIISMLIYPITLFKRKILSIWHPYRAKLHNNVYITKRKYKFFKFKIKNILKNRKVLYNEKKTKNKKKNKPKGKGALCDGSTTKDTRTKEQDKQRRIQKEGNGDKRKQKKRKTKQSKV